MDLQELVDRLIDAWNRNSVADILRLMSPDATYHDAFWGETCSGRDLVRYLDTELAGRIHWYEQDGDLIDTPGGVIFCYSAFDCRSPRRRELLYKGAEIITLTNGLITGISDFYCDPDPELLQEIATRIEIRRNESNVAPLGLSAKTSGFIKRRLLELGENTTIFLQPDLSPRQLADRVGCTVAHLVHVLEKEKETTFRRFVDDWRVRFAAGILAEAPDNSINLEQIASQSGFKTIEDFNQAFQLTFEMSVEEYSRPSAQQWDGQRTDDSIETA